MLNAEATMSTIATEHSAVDPELERKAYARPDVLVTTTWLAHDLNDPVVRDYVSRDQFQELLRAKGIDESTTVIFYGDKNNWWATYAFWVFQLFGFTNARLLDGGRAKWESEGRPMTTDVPRFAPTSYEA